jgi:AcrR family transcriptional regulator
MTQPATSLSWVKTPKQARSRATLQRFQQAAVDLLAESSWDQISVDDIARSAGSSVGAFYTRFADKDALLRSVHESFLEESEATSNAVLSPERWEGCSIPEIIRETVTFTIQVYREREGLIRALTAHAATNEDFRERGLAQGRHIGELLRKLILARRKELLHPAPAVAAEFSARLIHGLLFARALSGDTGESGSIKLTDQQIRTELIHAVLAYLGVFSTQDWDS